MQQGQKGQSNLLTNLNCIKDMYHAFWVAPGFKPHTPLTDAFFSPQNITFIQQEIEKRLRYAMQEPNIRLLLNLEFAQTMIDKAAENIQMDLHYLSVLNEEVIRHETEIVFLSQRAAKQYQRWIIEGNHRRVQPYGVGTKTQHKKGETTFSTSGYNLSHPWSRQHAAFRRDVLCTAREVPEFSDTAPHRQFPQP